MPLLFGAQIKFKQQFLRIISDPHPLILYNDGHRKYYGIKFESIVNYLL